MLNRKPERGWCRSHLLIAVLFAASLAACAPAGDQGPGPSSAASSTVAALDPAAHRAEVDAWHAKRIETLKGAHGWLSLVGLFWLEEGANSFGSAADNRLVFPAKAPAHAGVFHRQGKVVALEGAPGSGMVHEGAPVTSLTMMSDAAGDEETRIEMGTFQFYVIERGDRFGVRLKDVEAPVLMSFVGIDRFAVDPALRLEARWEPYDPPKPIEIPNVLGEVSEEACPGAAVFTVAGVEYRLEPTADPDGKLFFVFGDRTNGHETYGGGRFLSVAAPENGRVVLDFNKAYNPPCVFTPHATCPLPAAQNQLPVELRAGEKTWGEPHT